MISAAPLVDPRALLRGHQVLDRRDDRVVGDDARLPVDHRGQLAERPQAVLAVRLRHVAVEPAQLLGVGEALHPTRDVVQVEPREPDVDVAHPGEVVHGLAVRAHHGPVDDLALLGVEPAVAAGDREARHEPLDVPLERPWQRLVEVVDAEDQPPVRSGEDAEVREVRVAAELHLQVGVRRRGEIARHERGAAPVEGERGDEHAPVPDRDELGHPGASPVPRAPRRGRGVRRPARTPRAPGAATPRGRASPPPRDPRPSGASALSARCSRSGPWGESSRAGHIEHHADRMMRWAPSGPSMRPSPTNGGATHGHRTCPAHRAGLRPPRLPRRDHRGAREAPCERHRPRDRRAGRLQGRRR